MKTLTILINLSSFLLLNLYTFSQTGDIPVITCPNNIITDIDVDSCGSLVTYPDAIAFDTEDGELATYMVSGLPSGSIFPIGYNEIIYAATDADGNTVTCTFSVMVNDPIPPIITCQDISVVLDENGQTILNVAELVQSVDDNCSYSLGGPPSICEIENPSNAFENGNALTGESNKVVANDILINAAQNKILTNISANIFIPPGDLITEIDVFYYDDNAGEPGTMIGAELSVLPISQDIIGSNYDYDVHQVELSVTSFEFLADPNAEKTYWIGLSAYSDEASSSQKFWEITSASVQGYDVKYDDGTGTWQTLAAGTDGVYTFSFIGDGSCGYESEYHFDCASLGENQVSVTVTDESGNQDTCWAIVNVLDETPPNLACGPEPTLYDIDINTITPNLTIDTNGTDVIISSILSVAEDKTIVDLNVPMNISHTWIGDIYMTLTSPVGTTVVLHDMSGGSTQDIVVIYDDEGTAAAEALSAFDGESTMGDWTLYIEDTWPGLDGGMLNSWGIEYEYAYPNPETELFIELDENGTVSITPEVITYVLEDNCEIDVSMIDITAFYCSDIGTPTLVTLFVNDTSGNFASCQVEVNIVDRMAPELTCPPEVPYVFDPTTGFMTLPDYVASGDVSAIDNCSDSSNLVFTQEPPPDTMIVPPSPGYPYIITSTVSDEYGNISTCSYELVSYCSTQDNNNLSRSVHIYPNPSKESISIYNNTGKQLYYLQIFDNKGVLQKTYILNNKFENKIDISELNSGLYFVKIAGDETQTIKKLVKN